MTGLQPSAREGFTTRRDQPLIGLIERVGDEEVVRYFTDEESADAASSQRAAQEALSAIGAWSDLDWDEMVTELDRIRHESKPTPPLEL
jgi:hypothetical protein